MNETKRKRKTRRAKPVVNQPPANHSAARTANAKRRKRRRHGRYILHYILLVVFVLAAGIALSLTVFFHVDGISVSGDSPYTDQEIIDASGLQLGENLLRIDKEKAAQAIVSQFPYIQSVTVQRNFPSRIILEITQAKKLGVLLQDNQYLVIGETGKVLEKGTNYDTNDTSIPIIVGVEVDGYEVGDFITEEKEGVEEQQKALNQEGFVMFQYLVKAIQDTGFTGISSIDLSDKLNMKLKYEDRLILELGSEADLSAKLKFANYVIQNKLEEADEGWLDLSISKEAWFTPGDIHTGQQGSQILLPGEHAGNSSETSSEISTESLPEESANLEDNE